MRTWLFVVTVAFITMLAPASLLPHGLGQSVTPASGLVPVFPRFGCVYHEVTSSLIAMATGDINADGLTDAAFATQTGMQYVINLGRAGFSEPTQVSVGYIPTCVAVHDFNDDGFDDVLVARAGKPGALCQGTSSGAVLAPTSVNLGSGAVELQLVDVDGNSRTDVCAINSPGNTVSIVKNLGNGLFGAPVSIATPTAPDHLRDADLDGDGDQDLVVACSTFQKLHLLLNAGDGSYSLGPSVPTANYSNTPIIFALGDLDGDALPDLATFAASPYSVQLRRNAGGGVFTAIGTLSVSTTVTDLEIQRTDADSDADVVVLLSNGHLLVMDNQGDGTLVQREITSTLWSPTAITMVDFDAAPGPDLVVHDSSGWAVLANHNDGRFTPTSVIPINNYATPMSAIDADGDESADLVCVNTASHRIEILRNVTLTGYDAIQTIPVGETPRAVAVADVTGDGHDDILAVTHLDKTMEVIHSDGQGGFVHAATHLVSTNYTARLATIATGDLDNDGDVDVLIGDGGHNLVYLFLNTGTGTFFGPGELSIDDTVSAVNIGAVGLVDLNGDSLLDIVAAVRTDPGARIIMNLGSLSFGPLIKRTLGRAMPNAMKCADLDGDGDQELIISDELDHSAMIVWNDSDTLLSRRESFRVTDRPYSVAIGDIDEDNRPDIVIACGSGNAVSVFRNPGIGPWLSQVPHLTAGGVGSAVLADFNGDGLLDVGVGVSIASRLLSILPNLGPRVPPSLCPADIDGSLDVSVADFSILAAHFGEAVPSNTLGDLDGDGFVNITDFTIFATAFGQSCP